MATADTHKIAQWLKCNRPTLDELLGPWGPRGFAWEATAAFIAFAIEQRFGIPRGIRNRLNVYEVWANHMDRRFHPTFNVIDGEPLTIGDEEWMKPMVYYVNVGRERFELWIDLLGTNGPDMLIGSLLPWEPDPRARSESGTGDEFWSDIVAAARKRAYPIGRPMIHGLWTVSSESSLPEIIPNEAEIAALEAIFPALLARMS